MCSMTWRALSHQTLSQGYRIMSNAGGASGGPLGGAGRSELADVGLALAPQSFQPLTRLHCVDAVSPDMTKVRETT
jgi:hypothetical protein